MYVMLCTEYLLYDRHGEWILVKSKTKTSDNYQTYAQVS